MVSAGLVARAWIDNDGFSKYRKISGIVSLVVFTVEARSFLAQRTRRRHGRASPGMGAQIPLAVRASPTLVEPHREVVDGGVSHTSLDGTPDTVESFGPLIDCGKLPYSGGGGSPTRRSVATLVESTGGRSSLHVHNT